jgi:hypothetical protein
MNELEEIIAEVDNQQFRYNTGNLTEIFKQKGLLSDKKFHTFIKKEQKNK